MLSVVYMYLIVMTCWLDSVAFFPYTSKFFCDVLPVLISILIVAIRQDIIDVDPAVIDLGLHQCQILPILQVPSTAVRCIHKYKY